MRHMRSPTACHPSMRSWGPSRRSGGAVYIQRLHTCNSSCMLCVQRASPLASRYSIHRFGPCTLARLVLSGSFAVRVAVTSQAGVKLKFSTPYRSLGMHAHTLSMFPVQTDIIKHVSAGAQEREGRAAAGVPAGARGGVAGQEGRLGQLLPGHLRRRRLGRWRAGHPGPGALPPPFYLLPKRPPEWEGESSQRLHPCTASIYALKEVAKVEP